MAKAKDRRPLRDRYSWKKVDPAQPWRPAPGEELIGHYLGKRERQGQFGLYAVMTFLIPGSGLVTVSGVNLAALIDSALLERGELVRVIYKGPVVFGIDSQGRDKRVKTFELYRPDTPTVLPEARV